MLENETLFYMIKYPKPKVHLHLECNTPTYYTLKKVIIIALCCTALYCTSVSVIVSTLTCDIKC